MSDPMDDLNLPYEPVPGGPVQLPALASEEPPIICGGMSYRSAIIEIDPATGEKIPMVLWDFWATDGTKLPTIALIIPKDQMLALPDELRKAVRDAIRAAEG